MRGGWAGPVGTGPPDWHRIGVQMAVTGLAALLVLVTVLTLEWRLGHDSSILHYAAWHLDESGGAPYRDVFEMSMPGTFLVHLAILRTFGDGDGAFQALNVLFMVALFGATWGILRPFGKVPATLAGVLFLLLYLEGGRGMVLQRDVLLILPLATSMLLFRVAEPPMPWRAAAHGILVGCAATLKPHALLFLPVVLLFEARRAARPAGDEAGAPASDAPVARVSAAARFRPLLVPLAVASGAAAVGVLVPVALALAWVHARGGMPDFAEMAREYLPLYRNLSGQHARLDAGAEPLYFLGNIAHCGGYRIWLLPAAVGFLAIVRRKDLPEGRRETVRFLAAAALAMAAYATFGRKFWPYHWMPFVFCAVCLAALCVAPQPRDAARLRRWLPPVALALAVLVGIRAPHGTKNQLQGGGPFNLEVTRVDRISSFLRANLRPKDTVQPLDWTGGAVHAMLRARAPIATRYMADFHFHHDVSSPVIREMRRDFIAAFRKADPRFVIEVTTLRPHVSGPDTDRSFPELEEILGDRYATALAGTGFRILERRRP